MGSKGLGFRVQGLGFRGGDPAQCRARFGCTHGLDAKVRSPVRVSEIVLPPQRRPENRAPATVPCGTRAPKCDSSPATARLMG